MVRRRRTAARFNLECLESRRLLAIERPFVEHPWDTTLGDIDSIAVVADLDGDGVDDIVGAGRALSASFDTPDNAWYKFHPESNRFILAGVLPSRDLDRAYLPTDAVDFDSDGDLDLLVTVHFVAIDTYTGYAWIENLDGNGTFGHDLHAIAGSHISTALYIADLDLDGDSDAAYYGAYWEGDGVVGWAENVDGEFTFHQLSTNWEDGSYLYDVDGDGQQRVPEVIASSGGSRTFDLDGDGDLDWLRHSRRSVFWDENTDGMATFEMHTLFDSNDNIIAVRAVDVDQDQDVDIWIQSASKIVLLENDGTAQFSVRSVELIIPGAMVPADLDGDGTASLAGVDTSAGELVWYDYDWMTAEHERHSATIPQQEVAQALADMNGDGTLDLVGLRAWYEPADSLSSFVRHDYDVSRTLDVAHPMDVDGNGQVDVLAAWNTNTPFQPKSHLSWLQLDGVEIVEHPIAVDLSVAFSGLRTLDLDLDGDLDLLTLASKTFEWWEPVSGTLEWWENTDGHGAFSHRGAYFPVTSIWHVADMDGDGDMDVLRKENDVLKWHDRQSDGSFVPRIVVDSFNRGTLGPFVVGDIDEDGDPDVATIRDETVVWYENAGGGSFSRPEVRFARVPLVRSLNLVDLNGDGDLDLIVGSDESLDNNPIYELRPHPKMTYALFDNQDGRGDFVRVDNTLENRGILALVGDMNGDGAAELIESPREATGIIVHENVTPAETMPGDINRDGSVDDVDVDQFCMALLSGDVGSGLDLNGDAQVTYADFEYLVEQLAGLRYGDAGLDGSFDSSDLVRVLQRGHYEDAILANSGWQDGDWNCDREFSTSDLVVALQHGGYGDAAGEQFLLVTRYQTNQVLSFDAATGEFIAEFASIEQPADIAVGPDGDVYVAHGSGPLRVSRYRASGQLVASADILTDRDHPYLAFGPNGDLYVTYFRDRRIERFNVDNDAIVSMGDVVTPAQLASAVIDGFNVGPNGDLHLSVRGTQSIWRFSGTTGERLVDLAAVPSPDAITFGPNGDLYVGSGVHQRGQVQRFDPASGELIEVLIDGLPYIYHKIEFVFTDDGYLLLSLADLWGTKIYRYDAQTGDWIDILVGEGPVGLETGVDIALISV